MRVDITDGHTSQQLTQRDGHAAFAVFALATLLVIVPFLRIATLGALNEATKYRSADATTAG